MLASYPNPITAPKQNRVKS